MGLRDLFPGRPTLDRFAARLKQALRTAGEAAELRYDAAARRILRLRGGEPVGTIHLDNMFRTYLGTPRAGRAKYLKFCARAALAHLRGLPGDFEAARPDLRPKLWMRATFAQQRLRARLGAPVPRTWPARRSARTCSRPWPSTGRSRSSRSATRTSGAGA
jgi:hypothetical protein